MSDLIFVGYRMRGEGASRTFDEVFLLDVSRGRTARYAFEGRDPADPARAKNTIAKACRDFICVGRTFPPFPEKPPVDEVGVTLAGYAPSGDDGPSEFAMILATECAMPSRGSAPLPDTLVYGAHNLDYNVHHVPCDPLTEAEFDHPGREVAEARRELLAFAPVEPDEAEKYRELVLSWEGSGVDPQKDVALAFHLAVCYGLVAPPAAGSVTGE